MAELFRQQFDMDIQNIKGAGAAGGMGAGSIVFLKADLISGIDLVKDLIDFENRSKHADWIITGEGKLDHQTLSGKTIHGIIKTAKKYNIQVAAFCGSINLSQKELEMAGISYTDSVIKQAKNMEDAMTYTSDYLKNISSDFAKSMD